MPFTVTLRDRFASRAAIWSILVASMLLDVSIANEGVVDFQREIQPLLAEHCASCHGMDATSREGGLRLDVRDVALQGGDSGEPAIVPGNPTRSQLIERVTSDDPDLLMPPPAENKPLTAEQIQLLSTWIEQGASYTVHWAFALPRKAKPPLDEPAHPIDAWVAARLKRLALSPAPRAPDFMLCRRLYLDLIGLPPSPQELEEFARDGFDATVERLLNSERFGEKWARHWLDVARYSDTNGYEKDLRRDQWIWRDWVIDAFNRDLPYDQFLIEQIAGDRLPDATQQQIIATGFLRNSMLNEEGAIVPEQFRMVEMFDRMDCLGKSVLGLTTQCAQCHSHKFDPLTQTEYYGMFAFLNNSYEAKSAVYRDEQLQQIDQIEQAVRDLEEQVRQQHPQWQTEIAAWERDLQTKQLDWMPITATELGSVSGLNHPTQLADHSLLMLGHTSSDMFMIAKPELQGVTGLRLEVLTHGDLPFHGPGRGAQGDWEIVELEVLVQVPGSSEWVKLELAQATADYSQPEQKSQDGNSASGPVALLIDGSDNTTWKADRGIALRHQPSVAVVQFSQPLEYPEGTQLKLALRMKEMPGCIRASLTRAPAPAALPVDYAAVLALQTPIDQRSVEQQATIFAAWRKTLADCQPSNAAIDAHWAQYPQPLTTVLHLAEREEHNRRLTHFLERGEWDRPRQVVPPQTPAALHPLPGDAENDRLNFARWLASEQSPLAARVAVNRVWQAIFGEGLVETPEDFGTRAPVPEYLELLDWLAVDFMEHQWSHKHIIRTIVNSQTYQQDSRVSAVKLEQDPRNRWLSRGPRFRADAEVVRDIALSASGLITHRLGGPPVIPPVPQNVLDYNYVYPSYWTPTQGPDRYRRTLYGFRKRSMPDPVMSSFDGPNGDTACVRRVRSNTPLAALTGLNETIFVEAAQALALRVLHEAGGTDEQRADYAFLLCTARRPTPAERAEILTLLQSRRERLAEGWLNPREVATGDPSKLPELPADATPQDAAAWTIVARVLLNLDETLCKS